MAESQTSLKDAFLKSWSFEWGLSDSDIDLQKSSTKILWNLPPTPQHLQQTLQHFQEKPKDNWTPLITVVILAMGRRSLSVIGSPRVLRFHKKPWLRESVELYLIWEDQARILDGFLLLLFEVLAQARKLSASKLRSLFTGGLQRDQSPSSCQESMSQELMYSIEAEAYSFIKGGLSKCETNTLLRQIGNC